MTKIGKIRKILIRQYSQKQALENYTKFNLWQSEKIIIKKYFSKKDKILDIGCGAGRTTIALRKLGYNKIIGMDLVPAFIRKARQNTQKFNLKIDFQIQDVTSLKFPDNFFETIFFSFNGLEMIPLEKNRILALKEIYRVLKPRGKLIFSTYSRLKIGRRGIKWLFRFFKFAFLKIFKIKQKEMEFGDTFLHGSGYRKNLYLHISNPLRIINNLKKIGYKIIEINSQKNIEQNKRFNFLALTHRRIFYVVEK